MTMPPNVKGPREEFTDWPELIGESVLLRQRLHELDPDVNPYTLPRVGASADEFDSAEVRTGLRLDAVHRQLLIHANGWDDFFAFAHLLGTNELGSGEQWRRASQLLDVFYEAAPAPDGFPNQPSDVYCFCADPDNVEDLFVVWKVGPVTGGGRPVSWLAGEEVQRFPNMHEFMLSVNEYLRRDLAKLTS